MQLSDYDTFPSNLPIVVDDIQFLYPFMIVPLFLSDDENIMAIEYALNHNSLVFVATNKEAQDGNRNYDSIYDVGIIGTIMRKVTLPDGRIKVLFQGLSRGKLLNFIQDKPLIANIDILISNIMDDLKAFALLGILRENVKELSQVSSYFPIDFLKTIEENSDIDRIIELISSTIKLSKNDAYSILSEVDVEQRLYILINKIVQETQNLKLQKEIKSKVNIQIEKTNKEYFLREQLKQIQNELGYNDNNKNEEIDEYYAKLKNIEKFMDKDAYSEVKKQIDRYSKLQQDSSEANLIQNYIETVLEIPFGKISKKKLDIKDVQMQLDKDHYSLEKPKDRIVEFFAVKELLELRGKAQNDNKGTILCFIGPPGVGKTSLANSIATSLKRELVRIALGGLEDVNELRGHRRTYIGAMPGRIVQGLVDAKSFNPIVVLDEIDKIGRNLRGDPASALLEILDPEQNSHFRDNYLNFAIDLSKIVFIATANEVSTIPSALRDRMEFVEISSYTPQEKYQIAKNYLLPQEIKKHGLLNKELSITKSALETIIAKHTREAGVRNLRQKLATIARKSARKIIENRVDKISINLKNVEEFLDKTIFEIDKVGKKPIVGEVNGLAWTAVGGDVLKIEAIKTRGKGLMDLTGSLGDVMKESAHIAKSVVKVLIDNNKLTIDKSMIVLNKDENINDIKSDEIYKRYDLHIHVPEGATPKDGPSAGITMTTVIASILANKPIKPDVAMTGEITLSGRVLPIGGLKEKLIAAHKAGIKLAIIPKKNYIRDLDELPDEVKENINIVGVETIEDVLKLAFTDGDKRR